MYMYLLIYPSFFYTAVRWKYPTMSLLLFQHIPDSC
jgi:hypothetical protein